MAVQLFLLAAAACRVTMATTVRSHREAGADYLRHNGNHFLHNKMVGLEVAAPSVLYLELWRQLRFERTLGHIYDAKCRYSKM